MNKPLNKFSSVTSASKFINPVSIEINDLLVSRHDVQALSTKITKIKASLSGGYHSHFKGRGMQFEEVRPYVSGDDIKHLDWKVTARTNKPHTKLYGEERERPIQLFVDLGRSMFFGTRACFKAVWSAKAASLIAWTSFLQGDRVGGLVFSELAHQVLKPGLSHRAVLRVLKAMTDLPVNNPAVRGVAATEASQFNEQADDYLYYSLLRLRRVARPGSQLFLISDFKSWRDQHKSLLMRLGQHNEIILLFVYDRFESTLPNSGEYQISDGHASQILNANSRAVRAAYHEKFERHQSELLALAKRNNITVRACACDEPVEAVVAEILTGQVPQASGVVDEA